MDGEEPEAIAPANRRGRVRLWGPRRIAGALALVLLAALVALWLVRRPIARHFVDREFAKRGVPARYTLADLGFGRQRLTGVVLGDPARPDLVADWIETDTAVGLSGARLVGVRAGRVRLRGRIADGRLSLGSLDRLMPAGTGESFALPAIGLEVADARMALDTPAGPLALAVRGAGRLDGGFRGRLHARANRLAAGGCTADRAAADLAVTIVRAAPSLSGPVRAGRIVCRGVAVDQPIATATLALDSRLMDWRGSARLGAARLVGGGMTAGGLTGSVSARRVPDRGGAAGIGGSIDLRAGRFDAGVIAGEGARIAGRYGYDLVDGSAQRRPTLQGFMPDGESRPGMRVSLTGARLPPAGLAALSRLGRPAQGTPLAPLAARLAEAVAELGRRFDLDADVQPQVGAQGWGATVYRGSLHGLSGGELQLLPGSRISFDRGTRPGPRRDRFLLNGTLVSGGGGLPEAKVTLSQSASDMPVTATLAMRPYAAPGARLALSEAQAQWRPGAGSWRAVARLTLSGPVAGGRVENGTARLAAEGAGGRIAINPGCTPVGWQRIAAGGLLLDPGEVRLCATGPALARVDARGIAGGARLGPTRLVGRLGSGALDLRLGGAELGLAGRSIAARAVTLTLGDPAQPVRIEAARLDGRVVPGGLAGRFDGAGGRIGAVPLVLGGAAGDWSFARGRLAVGGALTVTDAVTPARFEPLAARDVALTLADNAIHAAAALAEPASGMRVATVVIDHALGTGRGEAAVRVAGIDFTPAFQPDRLTRLTYGVIADVRGTVSGDARIGWGPEGVVSTGTFRTTGTDLAAAFGPVTGLATEIRFTDLLSLASAPGQVATVASINPGIPVENGVVRYQTLPDSRVRVEGARWPFAGGTLSLEPTLLDFGDAGERRMTFTLDGVAADRFLQQFDFKNLDATGVFDGTLPMIFDASGGRIEGGRLVVRPGGGSLAYLGEISRRDVGFWANLAFGALRSLRYRDLAITMNGPLAGEMVTDVRFSGISQGQGATSNSLIRRLQKLPFVFNVRITAPFRGLIDSAQSFYDPKRLIDRNLPALLDAQNRRIQPPASEKSP